MEGKYNRLPPLRVVEVWHCGRLLRIPLPDEPQYGQGWPVMRNGLWVIDPPAYDPVIRCPICGTTI